MNSEKLRAPKPLYMSQKGLNYFLTNKPPKKRPLYKSNSNILTCLHRENNYSRIRKDSKEEIFFEFERNLDRELNESTVKEEIFSIFDRSTRYPSSNRLSTNSNDSFNDIFLRSSMPPIRSENPFHKNYDLIEDLEEM
jgi:hypothetical protein